MYMDTSGFWDDYYARTDSQSVPWNKSGAFLFGALEKKFPFIDPILDVGCGAGYKVKYLRSLGKDVYGFDFSEEAVRLANDARVVVGDLNKLKEVFPGLVFHTVLDLFASQFVKDRRKYLQQLKERVVDGGMILLGQFIPLHPYGKTDKDVIDEWLGFELVELKRFHKQEKPFNLYLFRNR